MQLWMNAQVNQMRMITRPSSIKTLRDKSLEDEVNPRLARIKERTVELEGHLYTLLGKNQEAAENQSQGGITSKVKEVWQPDRQQDHNSG